HPSLPGGRPADEVPSGRSLDVDRQRIQELLLAGAVASDLVALGAACRASLRRLDHAGSQVRNRRRAALELLFVESVPAAAADGVPVVGGFFDRGGGAVAAESGARCP